MKAVVFDLDGTLIDSAPDLHTAANLMLEDLCRPPLTLENVAGFVGNGVPTWSRAVLRRPVVRGRISDKPFRYFGSTMRGLQRSSHAPMLASRQCSSGLPDLDLRSAFARTSLMSLPSRF